MNNTLLKDRLAFSERNQHLIQEVPVIPTLPPSAMITQPIRKVDITHPQRKVEVTQPQRKVEVPTLKKLCENKIMKGNLHDIMTTYITLRDTRMEFVTGTCLRHLKSRFALLIERYDEATLLGIFEEDNFNLMKKELEERIEAERRIKIYQGSILETPIYEPENDRSCGNGFYSFSSLKTGATWPVGIDKTKREQYLCDTEFYEIFRMSKEEFNYQKSFVQSRLKKEKQLF